MKKLSLVFVFALINLFSMSSQAAQTSSTFHVILNLAPVCSIGTPADITVGYTSSQAGAATGSSPFNVTCTEGAPFTISLDSPTGVYTATNDAATNLNYTMGFGTTGALAIAAAQGTPANVTGNGGVGGAAVAYAVGVSVAGGQAGKCAGPTCSNGPTGVLHTVYLTY